MKNSIKPLNILGMMLLAIILFTSCSNDDDNPTIVTTYKLTMSATPASEGNTVFSTITYNDKDGVAQTLTDTSGAFEKSFDIEEGYNIVFNVSGTNDATTTSPPTVFVSYKVNKFENNVDKGTVCDHDSSSVFGTSGTWRFISNNNLTFNGTSCN